MQTSRRTFLKTAFLSLTLSLCSLFNLKPVVELNQIKGIFTVFNPEFSYLSPLHGRIWFDQKVIERMHRHGNGDDATIKLLRQLFVQTPGNFDVPNSDKQITNLFDAALIGQLINVIGEFKGPEKDIKGAGKQEFKHDEKWELLCAKQLADVMTKRLTENNAASTNSLITNFFKTYNDLRKQYDDKSKPIDPTKLTDKQLVGELNKISQQLEKEKNGLAQEKKDTKDIEAKTQLIDKMLNLDATRKADLEKIKERTTMIKKRGKDLDTIALLIVQSLQECGYFDADSTKALYLPYTTHTLLLAFLDRRAQSRNDYLTYFNQLNDKVFAAKIDEKQWASDRYDEKDSEVLTKKLFIEFTGIDFTYFIKDLESTAYAIYTDTIKKGELPPFARDGYVHYSLAYFPNCFDNTMRNIINTVAYDPKSKTFNLESSLPKGIDRNGISPQAATYFKSEFAKPSLVEDSKAHQIAIELVSNIPGVMYVRRIHQNKVTVARGYPYPITELFIHGITPPALEAVKKDVKDDKKDSDKKDIKEKKEEKDLPAKKDHVFNKQGMNYVIVPSEGNQLCEMLPSLKNLIVTLNYLLGLGLFDISDPKIYWAENFNTTYFPQLCEKLNWKAQLEKQELDAHDRTNTIDITTDSGQRFKITLAPSHGSVTALVAPPESEFIKHISSIIQTFNTKDLSPQAWLNYYDLRALVPEDKRFKQKMPSAIQQEYFLSDLDQDVVKMHAFNSLLDELTEYPQLSGLAIKFAKYLICLAGDRAVIKDRIFRSINRNNKKALFASLVDWEDEKDALLEGLKKQNIDDKKATETIDKIEKDTEYPCLSYQQMLCEIIIESLNFNLYKYVIQMTKKDRSNAILETTLKAIDTTLNTLNWEKKLTDNSKMRLITFFRTYLNNFKQLITSNTYEQITYKIIESIVATKEIDQENFEYLFTINYQKYYWPIAIQMKKDEKFHTKMYQELINPKHKAIAIEFVRQALSEGEFIDEQLPNIIKTQELESTIVPARYEYELPTTLGALVCKHIFRNFSYYRKKEALMRYLLEQSDPENILAIASYFSYELTQVYSEAALDMVQFCITFLERKKHIILYSQHHEIYGKMLSNIASAIIKHKLYENRASLEQFCIKHHIISEYELPMLLRASERSRALLSQLLNKGLDPSHVHAEHSITNSATPFTSSVCFIINNSDQSFLGKKMKLVENALEQILQDKKVSALWWVTKGMSIAKSIAQTEDQIWKKSPVFKAFIMKVINYKTKDADPLQEQILQNDPTFFDEEKPEEKKS